MNFLVAVILLLSIFVIAYSSPVLHPSSPNHNPFVLTAQDDVPDYRLPGNLRPFKYELTITPNIDQWTFIGHVIIQIQAQEADVSEIVLLSNDLTIQDIKVYKPTDPATNLHNGLAHSHDSVTHKLTIPLSSTLELATTYYVEINYDGYMKDDMSGFHRSIYWENGEEKRLGTTQFQTTSSRRAIPSFDEPGYKAVFELKILREAKYHTMSNTKTAETIAMDNNLYLDVFEPTPYMSIYLLAFIVSELKARGDENDDRFKVWARPDMYDQTEYAFQVGAQLLDHFNEYTDYNYYNQMKKLDMAAVPDNRAGGMENYGMIIYQESNLLYDLDKTTAYDKQQIAAVISHEQAHLWFGDLVTCKWWNVAWLNEGFARYHQYFTTAKVETEWDLEYQFVVANVQSVLEQDSGNNTNPINHVVNTPTEISAHFGYLSYGKGASLIRMMEMFMGEEAFQRGIRIYLKANSMSTTEPSDLYWALAGETDLDITSVWGSWADQEGYPVLTVEMNEDRTVAKLSQRRFFLQNPEHTNSQVYPIPVTFATPEKGFNDTTHSVVFNEKETELEVDGGGDSWIIFNAQQVGYYRVNYDEASWHLIHQALLKDQHDGIHVLNRAQILDDVFNLARGGLLDYQLVFDILDYLPTETDYIPWFAAVRGLNYISRRMAGQNSELFGNYVKKTFENLYQHLGFQPKRSDRQTEIYNRVQVLQWLCKYNHEECVANAKEEFQKAQEDESYLVPVDIREVVYCVAARHGDKSTYEWLWHRFLKEEVATEQNLLLSAMGCVEDEDVLALHLDNIFTAAVRKQVKSTAFSATLDYHDENVDKVFDYIRKNHAKIVLDLGSYSSLASYVSNVGSRITTSDQVASLTSFADENVALFGSSDSTLRSVIKSAEYELFWDASHLPAISSILNEKVGDGASVLSIGLSSFLVGLGVLLNFIFRF